MIIYTNEYVIDLHRQAGGLNSLLKISGYTASNASKEKRIGVPFAPSQYVQLPNPIASPFFTSNKAVGDPTRDPTSSTNNVRERERESALVVVCVCNIIV